MLKAPFNADFFGPPKLKGQPVESALQEILDKQKPHPENMKFFLSEYIRIKQKISDLSRSKRDYVVSRVESWIADGFCQCPLVLKNEENLIEI